MARRRPALLALVALLAMLLASCSLDLPGSPLASAPTTAATEVLTATDAPTTAPTDSPTATAAADTGAIEAIKAVVQRANDEQVQALAAGDPTLMRDTATAAYYQQSVQTLNGLASSGISAIALRKLEWGDITLASPTSAQGKTSETWRTSLSDKGVLEETDPNVYPLVREDPGRPAPERARRAKLRGHR